MADTPKISVIVPMYNVEKYLKTCVDSILNQTFKDFELLLIDNCSTDKTFEIAKSFSDSRIKIFQTEKNLGSPATPRNLGLDEAKGEFVYFVDADDAITFGALEMLHDKIIETDSDIVYGCTWMIPDKSDFIELVGLTGTTQSTPNDPVSTDLQKRIWYELCQNYMNSVLWLCLYRRKLFEEGEKIRFPNFLAEDVFVHFDLLCATEKIVKIETPFYIYRTNPNSITQTKKDMSKIIETIFAMNLHVRKKLSTLTDDIIFINKTCLSILNGLSSVFLQPFYQEDEAKIFHELEECFKKNFGDGGEDFAFIFYAYLWGQKESVRRTDLKKNLLNLIEEG